MTRTYFVSITLAFCVHIYLGSAVPDLKLVHVLFAHRLYAPWEGEAETNEINIPETLSYESFISSTMNIPMNAENEIYNLGVYLRKTYDEFLSNVYTSEIMKTRTTEHSLSILSAHLVNAGLWPPNWAMDLFPHGSMYNVTLFEYDLLSVTPLQRQLNGGTFLKEIIGNSLKYIIGDIPKERKMMLYSGDARNIVGVLKNLDLWSPHIPNEAAALIFELYFDNDTNTYGIKINYYMGTDNMTIVLSLPNCTDICPLQTLINATIDVIPQNSRSLCGWSTENSMKTKVSSENKESNSSSYNGFVLYQSKNFIFILILLYIVFNI